ncbi:MAG: ubiquitin family protein [bacterium]|nr:ubiquitin family protein [bacterium]
MSQADHTGTSDRPMDCIGLTIKTPAGFSSAFAARDQTTAANLVKRSVSYFEDRGQLEPGKFELALTRDGEPIDLDPDKPLGLYGLVEGDTLQLVSLEPHVDG